MLGLAPAAHGGNRTGRVFTGDRSGDFLFASMHRCGLANQPTSVSVDDGLQLHDAYVSAAVRCAPPANKPTVDERDACAPFMQRELALLTQMRVVVALGQFGYDAACRHYGVRPRPTFGHGVEAPTTDGSVTILCSFHPSQQNTFTGKLTDSMLDDVFRRAIALDCLRRPSHRDVPHITVDRARRHEMRIATPAHSNAWVTSNSS